MLEYVRNTGILYALLEETGGQDMLQTVNQVDIERMIEFLQDYVNNDMTEPDCFNDYCKYIRRFEELDITKDWNTAKSLFTSITT